MQRGEFEQLSAGPRCLAACPLPCQGLSHILDQQDPLVESGWVTSVCRAGSGSGTIGSHSHTFVCAITAHPHYSLQQMQVCYQKLCLTCSSFAGHLHDLELSDTAGFVLHCPYLMRMELCVDTAVREDLQALLQACAQAQGAARPQGAITVQLPLMEATTFERTQQGWVKLTANVAAQGVVMADCDGKDLLKY